MSRSATEKAAFAAFLSDPSTLESLAKYLRKRLPEDAVEDMVQTVLLQALKARDKPKTPGGLRAWLKKIAHDKAVNHLQQAEDRGELWPDRVDPDTVQVDKLLENHRDFERMAKRVLQGERDEQAFDWLRRHHVEGEAFTSIAEDAGLPHDVVRQRSSRLMRRLLDAASAAALILLLIMFASMNRLFLPRPRSDEARKDEVPTEPSASLPAGETPAQQAAELRAFAYQACDEGRWRDCNVSLNKADNLDPAGENDPREVAARKKLQEVLRELDRKGKTP